MTERPVTIQNRIGLHSRKASRFIKEAIRFKSDIYVLKDGVEYNGKSIMGILSMSAFQGDTITIRADGPDEKEAVDHLVAHIENDVD